MVKVYVAMRNSGNEKDAFKFSSLEPAYKNFIKYIHDGDSKVSSGIGSCPVVRDWYKNTFIFRSFLDLDVSYTDSSFSVDFHTNDPRVADDLYSIEGPSIIEIYNDHSFAAYCEEPLIMETTQYSSDFPLAPCRFDIGKWLRSPHPAIVNPKLRNLSIKRGEPMMYVRFLTDEPVEIVECDWTPEIEQLHLTCGKVRNVKARMGLNKLYELFVSSTMKRKVTRAFKAAVLGD